jgi:endonuclease-3
MTEAAWDAMFDRMRNAVVQAGGDLPSVSQIAREKQDPYRVLISTLLSLRTKDQVTLEASRRLFALADTPQAMVHLSQKEIEQAIFPAGFYHAKPSRSSPSPTS